MKYICYLFLLLPNYLVAQSICDDRYISEVFSAYTLTSNINYGANTTLAGVNQQLFLDFYEPTGDSLAIRPLIILVHGFPGDKTDTDIVYFCDKFVKRGYAVASVNTTLIDIFTTDTLVLARGVLKGILDFKAAIRYFKKDFATNNLHKIDTSHIFAGGFSWGATLGIGAAYFEEGEFDANLQSVIDTITGGIEGNSGNPGYSSRFHGVANIAGQTVDRSILAGFNPIPIVGIHGDADMIAPYDRGLNTAGATVDGSGRIHAFADSINLENYLITIPGGDHNSFYSNLAYRDSTEIIFAEFFL